MGEVVAVSEIKTVYGSEVFCNVCGDAIKIEAELTTRALPSLEFKDLRDLFAHEAVVVVYMKCNGCGRFLTGSDAYYEICSALDELSRATTGGLDV
jgi:ribosomal protein S27E